jgi:hypothetical protein
MPLPVAISAVLPNPRRWKGLQAPLVGFVYAFPKTCLSFPPHFLQPAHVQDLLRGLIWLAGIKNNPAFIPDNSLDQLGEFAYCSIFTYTYVRRLVTVMVLH